MTIITTNTPHNFEVGDVIELTGIAKKASRLERICRWAYRKTGWVFLIKKFSSPYIITKVTKTSLEVSKGGKCCLCKRTRAGFLDLGAPWQAPKFTCYDCMTPEEAEFKKAISR